MPLCVGVRSPDPRKVAFRGGVRVAGERQRLRVVRAGDARAVQDALAAALAGDGPALLPVAADAPSPSAPAIVAGEVALVVHTSGSTGDSKLVALSADAVRASSAAAAQRLGGYGQWLLALPAHYIAGLNVLARSIAAGTDPAVMPPGPFEAAAFARAAARLTHERRFTSLVPAQLSRLLDDPDGSDALRSFAAVLVGGQATPPGLLDRAREAGVSVVRTYGSSETTGGCVYDGIPLDGVSVRIAEGEVLIAGSTLAVGYLDEDATARAFILSDGVRWYRTGDTGALDLDAHGTGTLTVTGRLDDQIVSGGVNVSLGAVEAAVRRMPELADAVVVARPSERWGTVPVVVCTVLADLESVREQVANELGPAAAPAAAVRVGVIPLLPSGKPDRVALARLVAH